MDGQNSDFDFKSRGPQSGGMGRYAFLSPATVLYYECTALIFMVLFTSANFYCQYQLLRRQNRRWTWPEAFSSICFLLCFVFVAIQCGFSFGRAHLLLENDRKDKRPDFMTEMPQFNLTRSDGHRGSVEPGESFSFGIGSGLHTPFLTNWQTWFQFVLQISTVWLLKGCYLGFFFRLSRCLPKKVKYYLYGTASFCMLSAVACLLLVTLWCAPVSANWTVIKGTETVQCSAFGSRKVLRTLTSLCVSADLLILVLSILLISNLKLPSQSRMISIAISVFLGILSILASILRLVYFLSISSAENTFTNSEEYFKDNTKRQRSTSEILEKAQILQIIFRAEIMWGVLAYGFTFGRHWVQVLVLEAIELPMIWYRRLRYGKSGNSDIELQPGRKRRNSSIKEISTTCGAEADGPNCAWPQRGGYSGIGLEGALPSPVVGRAYVKGDYTGLKVGEANRSESKMELLGRVEGVEKGGSG